MTLPDLPPAFRWTEEPWGVGLRCRPLETIASHVFTSRQLQFTQPDALQQLAASVGAARVAMVTQVHTADVFVIRKGDTAIDGPPQADVLVANDPDVAIAVRAADCVPMVLADARTGVVAAVHAGWRGTAARAAVAAVDSMRREFGCQPDQLVAAIGPSIGPCCYEVGTELVDAFAAAGHERYLIERWFVSPPPARGTRERRPLALDLAGANRDQLILAGMDERRVHVSGLCTAMHLDLFTSFRAEREQAGRLAAVITASRLQGAVATLGSRP